MKHLESNARDGQATPISADGFMTVAQLATYLGLSTSAIYKLSSSHELPIYKPSKRVYFKKSEVDAWIERHRCASQEELERDASARVMTGGNRS